MSCQYVPIPVVLIHCTNVDLLQLKTYITGALWVIYWLDYE